MPLNNLKTDEIEVLFGHTLSADQILSLYPCDTGTFKKEDYDKPNLTITYDIHTAYNLRIKNVPFVVWEKSIRIIIEPLCFVNQDQRQLCFEKGYKRNI